MISMIIISLISGLVLRLHVSSKWAVESQGMRQAKEAEPPSLHILWCRIVPREMKSMTFFPNICILQL
jgi:hypothetical protein